MLQSKTYVFLLLFLIVVFSFPQKAFSAITFTISNPVVTSDDEIEVDATISGLISSSCSTSGCYLQAELRVIDETKGFFGYTYNNSGEFVDYFSSPSSVDEIKSKLFNFIPVSGAWSGKLKAKNNRESSNYIGPGQYTIRFRRFTGNSTSATSGDSNVLTITLTAVTPTPSPAPTSEPAPTSSSTSTNTPIPTKIPTSTPTPTTKPTNTPTPKKKEVEVVLGAKTKKTPTPKSLKNEEERTAGTSSVNPTHILFILIGGVFLVGCGILAWQKFDFFHKGKGFFDEQEN